MESENPPKLAHLVRRSRLAASWSQQVLAERSGLSVRMISDLERGLRLPRLESVRMLADAFDLPADQRAYLFAAARPELQNGVSPDAQRQEYRLPAIEDRFPEPANSFVGREQEVMELAGSIQRGDFRLITLTGPGGVGKTRLAAQVVRRIESDDNHQVHVVPLASVTNSQGVAPLIGRVFGLIDVGAESLPERLSIALGGKLRLLVLDNFEQLIPAAPLLASLVSACPSLMLLVTSRVVLRLSVEHEFTVQPLQTPHPGSDRETAELNPAVRLFVERSPLQDHDLTEEDAAAIAGICRRVDGLPLAIELAAAKSRLLTPSELLSRMDRALPLLTGGPRDAPLRLRSMHDAIAWSYDLLSPEEQRMLRLLSVFSGGFTVTAAEALFTSFVPPENAGEKSPHAAANGPDSVAFDILASLSEQSLLERYSTASGQSRFRMLETIREFGKDVLVAEGEERAIRDRHAAWFASQVQELVPTRPSHSIVNYSDPLENEHDNLRSAIVWSLAQDDAESAGRLATGLDRFWAEQSLNAEARATLGKILESTGAIRPELRASLLLDAARSAWCQSDFGISGELAAEAHSIYEEIGDQSGIAASLPRLGDAALANDPRLAVSLYRESVALQRALGNVQALESVLHCLGDALVYTGDYTAAKAAYGECLSLMAGASTERWLFNPLGWVALAEHDLDLAERLLQESLAYASDMGIPYPQGVSLRLLGRVCYWRGELDEATSCYQQALDLMIPLGAMHEANYCVAELGAVAQAGGDDDLAARWLGFEEEQRARQRLGLSPDESEIRERASDLARERLGAKRFESAWNAGRSLTAPQAYAEARARKP